MSRGPERGDILLRGSVATGFELVDAITHAPVAGPVGTLEEALAVARANRAPAVWHQTIDDRGRPLGNAFQLAAQFEDTKRT